MIAVVAAFAAVAVVVGVVAFAGGSGSSSTTAGASLSSVSEFTTTTVAQRSETQRAADVAALASTVIHPWDIGDGWSASPDPEGGKVSAAQIAADPTYRDCLGVGAPAAPLDPPSEVTSDLAFDGAGRFVQSQASMYANPGLARDDIELLTDRNAERCIGTLVDRDIANIVAEVGVGKGVKYTNAVTSPLETGSIRADDVVGVRASVPIQAGQEARHIVVDVYYARHGRTIIVMRFLSVVSAVEVDTELALTNTVVGRG